MSTLTLIPYYGGKARLASRILPYITQCCERYNISIFGETCGGGARMLLNLNMYPRISNLFYNEVDVGLCNLFKCCSVPEQAEKLIDLLMQTGYSKEIFTYAKQHRNDTGIDLLLSAALTYIAAKQSTVGGLQSFRWSKRQNENHRMVFNYYRQLYKIRQCSQRLQGLNVYTGDFRNILDSLSDRQDALIYIDPPYTTEQRTSKAKKYLNELADSDHIEMVDILLHIKCKVVLSGYDNKLYDKLVENGWHKIFLGQLAVSSGYYHQYKERKDEFIWLNF